LQLVVVTVHRLSRVVGLCHVLVYDQLLVIVVVWLELGFIRILLPKWLALRQRRRGSLCMHGLGGVLLHRGSHPRTEKIFELTKHTPARLTCSRPLSKMNNPLVTIA
jgi:hypothetical protein